jgi:ribonuclease G
MPRQNVTDGPREVMTRKCPTCGGDGIVYSEASAALDVERRLRALATGSRSQAFKVELAAPIAAALTGPGARRLMELETLTKRRFFLTGKPDMHADHFVVLGEGKLADVAPSAPVEEGAELMVELVEVDRHDAAAGVAHVDGIDVCVGDAAELVGKKVKVKVERVFDGIAYASLVRRAGKKAPEPLTAEGEAEKPTRKPPARKGAETDVETDAVETAAVEADAVETDAVEGDPDEEPAEVEIEAAVEEATTDGATPAAKKKTRRGSRGGRNRKKKPAADGADGDAPEAEAEADAETDAEQDEKPAAKAVRNHLPPEDLGEEEAAAPSENGDAPAAAATKKRTRRGSRGGKNRRKREAGAATTNGAEPGEPAEELGEEPEPEAAEPEAAEPAAAEPEPAAPESETEPDSDEEWGYVPMSQWGDDFQRS